MIRKRNKPTATKAKLETALAGWARGPLDFGRSWKFLQGAQQPQRRVEPEAATPADAFSHKRPSAMKVVGDLDQRLGRHAARAGARRAVGSAVDQDEAFPGLAQLRDRGKTRGTRPDDGDVDPNRA